MQFVRNSAITLLVSVICAGCAERVPRAQDEAMLLYRECMNGMQQWGASPPSPEALSKTATRQSVASVMKSDADARMQSDCAQSAGWEEK